MDVIEEIIRSALMLVGLVVVLLLIAALFMIIFKIATGIDDQIQE
jgi:flagellar biosynthesis protein FliQ